MLALTACGDRPMPPVPALPIRPAGVAGSWSGLSVKDMEYRLTLRADGGGSAELQKKGRRQVAPYRVRDWGETEGALLVVLEPAGEQPLPGFPLWVGLTGIPDKGELSLLVRRSDCTCYEPVRLTRR